MAPFEKKTQRDYRCFRTYTDDHGRKFTCQADAGNQQPIGELMPQGFQPPWLPPMRFAKWRASGELDFRWDYATMADELSGDTAAYYQDATRFAIENNKPEPEMGGPVDRSIRYVLGPPPMSPAIPMAAEIGDPWILGVPGAAVNESLKAILEQHIGANGREALDAIRARMAEHPTEHAVPSIPGHAEPAPVETVKSITDVTYQSFLTESRKRGMSIADIALAWKAHKENVAEDAHASRAGMFAGAGA